MNHDVLVMRIRDPTDAGGVAEYHLQFRAMIGTAALANDLIGVRGIVRVVESDIGPVSEVTVEPDGNAVVRTGGSLVRIWTGEGI